jgi:hypothetical protein
MSVPLCGGYFIQALDQQILSVVAKSRERAVLWLPWIFRYWSGRDNSIDGGIVLSSYKPPPPTHHRLPRSDRFADLVVEAGWVSFGR